MVEMRAVVVTVSDTRDELTDRSGKLLCEKLNELGVKLAEKAIITDELDGIAEVLKHFSEREDVNLIFTTGGTGLSPRDNTPEATKLVIEREVPGFSELMRIGTRVKTPRSVMSRGVCGIASGTLIVNLPGSPGGVEDCLAEIAPLIQHAVNQLAGDSSH